MSVDSSAHAVLTNQLCSIYCMFTSHSYFMYNMYINLYTQFTVKLCITRIWKKRRRRTVVYAYQNTCACRIA